MKLKEWPIWLKSIILTIIICLAYVAIRFFTKGVLKGDILMWVIVYSFLFNLGIFWSIQKKYIILKWVLIGGDFGLLAWEPISLGDFVVIAGLFYGLVIGVVIFVIAKLREKL